MAYIVLCRFADAKDGLHVYNAGDTFPREGVEVDRKRLAQLLGSSNSTGRPLIAETAEKPRARKKGKASDGN